MGRQLTPRGLERRRQLLAYATTRFAENGYHPTSVADIVQGLGVGKGVFYWYFDSKEQLFLEILRDAQRDLRRAQRAAASPGDDPLRRIELGIRASIAWSATHQDVNRLIQFAVTEERFLPAVRQGQEVAVADGVAHVVAGMEQGLIRDGDPLVLTHAILGLTTQLVRAFLHEEHRPPDEVADAAVAFVLAGLAAPGALATAP